MMIQAGNAISGVAEAGVVLNVAVIKRNGHGQQA